MTYHFDRKIYFDSVRSSLFVGGMSQQQVDGQEAILTRWEKGPGLINEDLRHLSYPLATTYHETGQEMWPIEEYGKGEGKEYGKPAGPYGEIYFGRGDVQLTWWENYVKARDKLGLSGENDLERFPERALDLDIAAQIMFEGMKEGWFRTGDDGKPETMSKYFSTSKNDAYGAREIINGDKHIVPSWSNGVSIGNLIRGYHEKFLDALGASLIESDEEEDGEEFEIRKYTINVELEVTKGAQARVITLNIVENGDLMTIQKAPR